MNSSKKAHSSLWVLEEDTAGRSVAENTSVAVESLMERLKARARAHARAQARANSSMERAALEWGSEAIRVRVTSQEGLPIQDG